MGKQVIVYPYDSTVEFDLHTLDSPACDDAIFEYMAVPVSVTDDVQDGLFVSWIGGNTI